MRASYIAMIAYLQNSPGSNKAVAECVRQEEEDERHRQEAEAEEKKSKKVAHKKEREENLKKPFKPTEKSIASLAT